MTYEEYESHDWQEGEELMIDGEVHTYDEHDEVYGNIWVKNPNMKRAKCVCIEAVEIRS